MTIEKAILLALTYHDIFEYPLTVQEIHKYLPKPATVRQVSQKVEKLINKRKIGKLNDFYFLNNNKKGVSLRSRRYNYSKNKMKKARLYSNLLKLVPTISGVCLTGALAMDNSTKNDDIDLLVITKRKSLWTSRFFANLVLLPFKRTPNSKKNSDKACLNIFLDESDLKIKEKNIYIAHELYQLKLLWGTSAYSKLIGSNISLKDYLPNWHPDSSGGDTRTALSIPNFVEQFFLKFQLFYMSSKLTVEKVGDTQVFFHPRDTQTRILKEYAIRQKRIIDRV